MNKMIILISLVVSILFLNFGMSTKTQVDGLRGEVRGLKADNFDMEEKIKDKELLVKREPINLSTEYGLMMNRVRMLESYSGTNMDVQLEGAKDTDDVTKQYMDTRYKGVRGLKIKIVVNKFSKDTNMGAVLDDIHLLEKSTDFMASEISKDNNNLIVKGEVYGL